MTAALTEVLLRVTAVGRAVSRAVSGSVMVLVASVGGVGVMMASMGWVGVMVATIGGVARISSGGKAGYSTDECWKQHHGNEQQCSRFHLAFEGGCCFCFGGSSGTMERKKSVTV